nr:hypothetical protein 11 [Elusimicrobiota bacterium]
MVMAKKKAGRKLFDGKDYNSVLQKLEQVWSIGGTDVEAALYAEISKSALYEFLKSNPDISERKNMLKNKPILKARQEVFKGLTGNHEFALKYLERKLPNEFALRNILENKDDNKPIQINYISCRKVKADGKDRKKNN